MNGDKIKNEYNLIFKKIDKLEKASNGDNDEELSKLYDYEHTLRARMQFNELYNNSISK